MKSINSDLSIVNKLEKNLEKVKNHWDSHGERGRKYIQYAQDALDAARNGGEEGWKKFISSKESIEM